MIRGFVDRIMATKKYATEKNVLNWHNCVFHSLIIILGVSMILSLYTLLLLSDITLDTTIGELLVSLQPGIFLPIFYSAILSYLFLEKLIKLHILVFQKFNKLIFKAWQKLDMYWFKKYKKSSPLTEGMAKVQNKVGKYQSKSSKKQRKLIAVGLIAVLILLQFGLRYDYFVETFSDDPEIQQQEEQQEVLDQVEQDRVMVNIGR